MDVVDNLAELRARRPRWGDLGLVPTMGYLHDGHLSLIRAARAASKTVLMSLFVNPAQFGPSEDFASYPRDEARDLQLAESAGADVVFKPSVEQVYPVDFDTWVDVGALTTHWEGEFRPGHFRGVATVVLKLFQMVQADRAFFGEKDFQQLLVVRKMVADLHLPIEVVGCPTIREPGGLALSSRNAYLTPERRQRAAIFYRALQHGQELAAQGEAGASRLIEAMRAVLADEPGIQLQYLGVVDPHTLKPLDRLVSEARLIGALYFDRVRLIDNVLLQLGGTT